MDRRRNSMSWWHGKTPGPMRGLLLWVAVLCAASAWALHTGVPSVGAHGSAAKTPDIVSLPYFLTNDLTPTWPSADQLREQSPAFPDFNLLDQAGRRVNKSTLAGKVVVANFFFTQCSRICPKLTSAMAQVRDAQRGHTGLLLLSHSVTPEWDTPPMLMAYAQANRIDGQQWRLLTGSNQQINQVAHQGYFVPRTAVADDGFIHTELFVLLDQQQHIRGVYNGSLRGEVNQLLADVALLLGTGSGSKR
jgi:protein SCO1